MTKKDLAVIFTTECGKCFEIALTEEMKECIWGDIVNLYFPDGKVKYIEGELTGITIEPVNKKRPIKERSKQVKAHTKM